MVWRGGLKNRAPRRSGSPLRAGAQQVQPGLGQCGFKVAAVVVLVRDQGLSGSMAAQFGVGEDVQRHHAFIGLGAGQRSPDRKTAQGAQQVQPQSAGETVPS